MEKPKCCLDCPCYNGEFTCCQITGAATWEIDVFNEVAEDCPLVDDVASIKHGKWECVQIDYDVRCNMATMRCPICKRWHSGVYHYGNPTEYVNYCSYCGARMEN